MRNATGAPRANRVQRLSVVSAIAISALAFTGCSAINQQSTTIQYSASDGVRFNMGKLEMRNVLIISEKAGAPGRFTGTFYNTSDTPITLTVGGSQGSRTELTVPAGGQPLVLDTKSDAAILSTVDAAPGAVETVKLAQSGSNNRPDSLMVPVLDGTLAEYKKLVPTPTAAP